MSKPIPKANRATRRRYQRISRWYDWMEILPERKYRTWRKQLWSRVPAGRILEVGVGTGKNMPYYPPGGNITAIDLTPGMLKRARRQARRQDRNGRIDLYLGDVQALAFADASFDSVVATFVFCSVPDPILGLGEVSRVLRPEGHLWLLEHMRADNNVLGAMMSAANPLVVRLTGANIHRRTLDNIQRAGLRIDWVKKLDPFGIFRMIAARNNSPNAN